MRTKQTRRRINPRTSVNGQPPHLAGIPAAVDTMSGLTPPLSSESNLIKQEKPAITNTSSGDLPPPPFMTSINELRGLSTALSTFLRRYDELHNHLNFINSCIDSKLPNHLLDTVNPNQLTLTPITKPSSDHTVTTVPDVETTISEHNPNGTPLNFELSHQDESEPESPNSSMNTEETDASKKPEETYTAKKPEEIDNSKKSEETDASKKPEEAGTANKPEETDASKKPEETDASKKHEETDASKKPEEADTAKKPEEIDNSMKPAVSELESLCRRMHARELKKYVATHISHMYELRDHIPKALKVAKDPAKLVLDSIGRFFVQSSKAYHKGPSQNDQIVGRLSSVLILEGFVMISSDGIEIAVKDEEYAAEAAGIWQNRMIKEGGLRHVEEADARGLLLLISGFGIPDQIFKSEDIKDLIRASNVKGISTALRRSVILIPKIPEVIDLMVKDNLEIEAADLAYTFGLEDKCHPQTILTTFLHNTIKDVQNGSSVQVIEAMKQQLSDLKSVKSCLESNNVVLSKLHLDFNINERIQHLEKEIKEKKPIQKRKALEAKSIENSKHQGPKRARMRNKNDRHLVDDNGVSPYNRSTQPSNSYFDFDRDRNLSNNCITAYAPSSVFSASALPESITGSVASVYRGTVAAHQMMHTAMVRPYSWHEDPALTEKHMGQPYLRQSQTYDSPSSSTGLYGRTSEWSTRESFPGFPGKRGPSSDLYSFADTVVEKVLRTSGTAGSGTVHPS